MNEKKLREQKVREPKETTSFNTMIKELAIKIRTSKRVAFQSTTTTSKRIHQGDAQEGNCYNCHRSGHLASDCPQSRRSPVPPTPPAPAFRRDASVSEIGVSRQDSDDSESDPESSSEN